MTNLTKIIYLSQTDFNTLVSGGTVIKEGVTYSYDPTVDYRVAFESETVGELAFPTPTAADAGKVVGVNASGAYALSTVDESHFVGIWNCLTGIPTVGPTALPYTYRTGDYYRVGNCGNGYYEHSISLAGTAATTGIHEGTYNIKFEINNLVSNAYTSISDIAQVLGENGVEATGTLYTTDAGDITIVKVIEWTDEGNYVIAMLDDTNQKVALTLTTATELVDTVSGGLVNYKPNGATYTGAASATVESESVKIGWTYYYNGSAWLIARAPLSTWGSITGTLSDQTDLQTALDTKGTYSKPASGIPKTDLASAVQTSLDKADSALQTHQSLSAYRTSAQQDAIDVTKQDKRISATATLAVASWSNKSQTVSVTGVTDTNLVLVSAAPASTEAWADAKIYCSAQATDSLTFTCIGDIPEADVTANIVILP